MGGAALLSSLSLSLSLSLSCALTLLGLALVLCYVVPIFLLHSLGLLALSLLLPRLMLYVYPTRLGLLHVVAFKLLHSLTGGGRPHSRSVRVQAIADGAVVPYEHDPLEEEGKEAGASTIGEEEVWVEDEDEELGVADKPSPPPSPPAASSGGAKTPFSVHTVALLLDNYCYVIVDTSSCAAEGAVPPAEDSGGTADGDVGPSLEPLPCALVDPADPSAVLAALSELSRAHYGGRPLLPSAILTTHKHWDHAAGNERLHALFPSLAVYGGAADRVAACTHPLDDGDCVPIGRLRVLALAAPGHTVGSIAYLIRGSPSVLFGGDVLFCGGCGAPFEGDVPMMCATFAKLWRACPAETLLFPGHEYTLSVLPQYLGGGLPMPDSADLFATVCAAVWRAKQLRAQSPPCPTVPLSLVDELRINDKFGPLRRAAAVLLAAWHAYAAMADGASRERGDRTADSTLTPANEGTCEPCAVGAEAEAEADADGECTPSFGLSGLDPRGLERELLLVPRSRLRALAEALLAREPHVVIAHHLGACIRSPLHGGMMGMLDAAVRAADAKATKPAAPESYAGRVGGGDARGGAVVPEVCLGTADRALATVTTREVGEAFALVGGGGDGAAAWMHAHTLVRLLTSPHLHAAPLVHTEALRALKTIGCDGHGRVLRSDLEGRLGVAPPQQPGEPQKGRCARACMCCCPRVTRGVLNGVNASARALARLRRSRGRPSDVIAKGKPKREAEAQVLLTPAV